MNVLKRTKNQSWIQYYHQAGVKVWYKKKDPIPALQEQARMHVSKSTQYQDHADMNFFLSTQYQDQVAMFKSRCQTTTGRCVWMVSTQLTIVVSYGTRIQCFISIHPSIHPCCNGGHFFTLASSLCVLLVQHAYAHVGWVYRFDISVV